MDVGLAAEGNEAALIEENEAAAKKDDRELLLLGSIAEPLVTPIIKKLQDAKPGERFRIYLRANLGGNVRQLMNLIEALGRTDADVEIAIGRYAMSAAAMLWLWFALEPINEEDGGGKVISVDPLKPAVLVYHRPRLPHRGGEYYCFVDDVVDPVLKSQMQDAVADFDGVFNDYLAGEGFSAVHAATVNVNGATFTHHLHFLKETYESNRDCIIPLGVTL
ncbi:hypothetical protein PFWH6_1153 [Pseudomonas fluorescens WH6]|nr:hypothetical protein PFWH6_1153 [Pseudomonas fluorescens WH6]